LSVNNHHHHYYYYYYYYYYKQFVQFLAIDDREALFLFQLISVTIQRFDSIFCMIHSAAGRVAHWSGGTSACCTAGPIVRYGWQWMAA